VGSGVLNEEQCDSRGKPPGGSTFTQPWVRLMFRPVTAWRGARPESLPRGSVSLPLTCGGCSHAASALSLSKPWLMFATSVASPGL
jgi:hypothetical protein